MSTTVRPHRRVPTLTEFAPRFVDGHTRANRQKPSGIANTLSVLTCVRNGCCVRLTGRRSRGARSSRPSDAPNAQRDSGTRAFTSFATASVRTWRCEARPRGPSRNSPVTPTCPRRSGTCTSVQPRQRTRSDCWTDRRWASRWRGKWRHDGDATHRVRKQLTMKKLLERATGIEPV